MQRNKRIEMALSLATYAHDGQKDKAGKPYIEHPINVALNVHGEKAKIVALLHDVVEDSFVTFDTIENLFGKEIRDAIDCLTHRDNESYDDYIIRLSHNPLAITVKLSDLKHNMDLSRLNNISEQDLKRLAKYQKAKAYLESKNATA